MSLISLLIVLLIFCVILWAARTLLAAFNVGNPIASVVYVIIVLVMVVWVIQSLGLVGGPVLSIR